MNRITAPAVLAAIVTAAAISLGFATGPVAAPAAPISPVLTATLLAPSLVASERKAANPTPVTATNPAPLRQVVAVATRKPVGRPAVVKRVAVIPTATAAQDLTVRPKPRKIGPCPDGLFPPEPSAPCPSSSGPIIPTSG